MLIARILGVGALASTLALACSSDDSDEKAETVADDDTTGDDTTGDDTTGDDTTGDDTTGDDTTGDDTTGDDTTGDDTTGDDTTGDDTTGATETRFRVTVSNEIPAKPFMASGVFNTPDGADAPGPLLPGDSYAFSFDAAPGHRLNFATMMVQSNDWFAAAMDPMGIALYDDEGTPMTGDVTSLFALWDAGTEADEEPGAGPNQAPRQGGIDVGDADPAVEVRLVDPDGLPTLDEMISVTLAAEGSHFTLTITNVSTDDTLMPAAGDPTAVPFAPGTWVVGSEAMLFEAGKEAPEGLEPLAEDGNPAALFATAEEMTGVVSPLAPGVFVVHSGDEPLFSDGEADRGDGLESLAEDGSPMSLLESLSDVGSARGVFAKPDGGDEAGPLLPGHSYEFEFSATPGDRLSLATMFVQSNDLFFAFGPEGVALFDQEDMPVEGELEGLMLWDAGTEVNQAPGVGDEQAPRQGGTNIGTDEDGKVQPVDDGYTYPDMGVSVSIEVIEP